MRSTLTTFLSMAGVFSAVILCDAQVLPSAELDKEKSTINFVGRKTDGKHDGGFKNFAAEAQLTPDNLSEGSLVITIDATSLWSDNPKLTNHLKNPDFFDVRKYPKIEFESTGMTAGDSKNKGFVTGKLTMLGKTNEVKIPVVCTVEDGTCNLKADFEIDRMKWGMTYGKGKIDDTVQITALLVFNP